MWKEACHWTYSGSVWVRALRSCKRNYQQDTGWRWRLNWSWKVFLSFRGSNLPNCDAYCDSNKLSSNPHGHNWEKFIVAQGQNRGNDSIYNYLLDPCHHHYHCDHLHYQVKCENIHLLVANERSWSAILVLDWRLRWISIESAGPNVPLEFFQMARRHFQTFLKSK